MEPRVGGFSFVALLYTSGILWAFHCSLFLFNISWLTHKKKVEYGENK